MCERLEPAMLGGPLKIFLLARWISFLGTFFRTAALIPPQPSAGMEHGELMALMPPLQAFLLGRDTPHPRFFTSTAALRYPPGISTRPAG
jgi:hypothetical protein